MKKSKTLARTQKSRSLNRVDMPPRPGAIKSINVFESSCWKCAWRLQTVTYQEASIALTIHLDHTHEGWTKGGISGKSATTRSGVCCTEWLNDNMNYQLYKDGYGFAVYDPNDGQIRHTQKYLEATEASPASWADVLGDALDGYHQILSAPDAARLIPQSSNHCKKCGALLDAYGCDCKADSPEYCACVDWPVQIELINAPIILQSLRAGKDLYTGVPFRYCPWCGKKRPNEEVKT